MRLSAISHDNRMAMEESMIRINRFNGLDNFLQEMDTFQRQLEGLFSSSGNATAGAYPPVNIYQNDDGLLVYARVPGLHAENIELTVTDDLLTIAGNVQDDSAQASDATGYLRNERSSGQFQRTIRLPYVISADKVEAIVKDGILRLVLPRAESDKPRKIAVKTN